MKLSTKAALFSALIYPGAGFFLLKKPWLGIAFFIPTTLALTYVLRHSMKIASQVADKIMAGQIATDPVAISAAISAATPEGTAFMFALAKWLLMLIWLAGILVCYAMGKRTEKSLASLPPQKI